MLKSVFKFFLISISFNFVVIGSSSLEKVKKLDNCLEIIKAIEDYYGIPEGLLQAISAIETRTRPWAVCAKGKKGKIFKTKKEAIDYVKKSYNNKKVDCYIGCMQISYKFHKKKFEDIDDFLNPYSNINYAAKMLVDFYKRFGSWNEAIKRYHSTYPSNKKYQAKILRMWAKIMKMKKKVNNSSTIKNIVFNDTYPPIVNKITRIPEKKSGKFL